jgi:MFS family permease
MLAWSQESALTASACNGPDLLLAPFAGVLADRWNRHWMLVITQTLAQALILAALVLAGTIHIEEIVTLSLLLGPVNAFDMPTGRSFLVQLIAPNGHLFLHPECGTSENLREETGQETAAPSTCLNATYYMVKKS